MADGGESVDVGIEYYPSATSSFGGRLMLSTQKEDPDKSFAEASEEHFDLGLRLQLLSEFGRGVRADAGHTAPAVSLLGAAADLRWGAAIYEYNPAGGAETSDVNHSWSAELRGWWFGTVGGQIESAPPGGVVPVAGTPPSVQLDNVRDAWVFQPQLRVGFERKWKAAADSYLVREPQSDGLQLAEKLKLEGPSIKPAGTVLVALAFQPPRMRFAFAPAVRLSSNGGAGDWDPTSAVTRLRMEAWVYYFAFGDGPAVRFGVAPFLDQRLAGSDKREEVVGGALLELRATASRLEY